MEHIVTPEERAELAAMYQNADQQKRKAELWLDWLKRQLIEEGWSEGLADEIIKAQDDLAKKRGAALAYKLLIDEIDLHGRLPSWAC